MVQKALVSAILNTNDERPPLALSHVGKYYAAVTSQETRDTRRDATTELSFLLQKSRELDAAVTSQVSRDAASRP